MMKNILLNTSYYLATLQSIVKLMEKQPIYYFTLQHIYSNIEMIYIIRMLIPTKVDTSQVPQQNVNLHLNKVYFKPGHPN